jgi:hypothetical protein
MKSLKINLTIVFTIVSISCIGQFRSSNFGGYTFSIQVDSSHIYILGGQPNRSEKAKYIPEDRSQGFTSYSGEVTLWNNVYVYNDSTGKLLKIFDSPLIGVYPAFNTMVIMKSDYYFQRTIMSGVSKDNLIFAVKTDTYNNDGVLDSDDPVYLFASRKDGTDCRQITPNGMHVTNWRLTKDGKGLLVTLQVDKDSDKKFTEDEELYKVDLNSNVSQIKIRPISVSNK